MIGVPMDLVVTNRPARACSRRAAIIRLRIQFSRLWALPGLSGIHIDAHCDTTGKYEGAKFHHGGRLGVAAVAGKCRDVIGGGPVYISLDVDGIDPAFAPGMGTPEVGG